ncbi:LacI family transcriptional regulator [Motilibacter rhizosphaerae]|uniref:LacI family transcriptional regulator n=1 Tax=Motilibacter rhizosphaerae TaxID=598652 RepID=A0A4Q7NR47_9ACTN|nr:LacI family DNA-binding transcriptional regulator [Motilibacter rhizosphaerae]RZS89527.1 LacI family transcriptional regulator [Motilibacter rhizosphaerae]
MTTEDAPGAAPDRRPTLAMVAETAGVSAPTVSKVLNGRADVAPETRARVEQAVRELRYVPGARRAHPEERIVEIVFDDLLNSYASEIIDGAVTAGVAKGITVVPRRVGDDVRGDWARRVRGAGREGVIVVTSVLTHEQIAQFTRAGLSLVVIDAINPPRAEMASIGSTNFLGAVDATDHLLGLGHRRIAHLGGASSLMCSLARAHGFRAAMERAGVPVVEDLVVFRPFTFEAGVETALPWLRGAQRPTAVFAASDGLALGVLEAARQCGLRVPEDLSVVGFDDTYAAAMSAPPLTTVHQPLREMGARAVDTLLGIAAGDPLATYHIELATRLTVRSSTAPAPTA